MKIKFILNDSPQQLEIDNPVEPALHILRTQVGLTGSKEGCGEGECGACTIRVDGLAVNSCLIPIASLAGKSVHTIEGICQGQSLSDLQQKLIEHGATQCGICTPGIVMAAQELLDRKIEPTRDTIREALAGNLCRCTGYQLIVDAVVAALDETGESV